LKYYYKAHLNVGVVIVAAGQVDKDGKERQHWGLDEEQALGPHHHEGNHRQDDRDPHEEIGLELALPVPFCNEQY
jgi:hypothetical protein